jgi:hypothetical protein
MNRLTVQYGTHHGLLEGFCVASAGCLSACLASSAFFFCSTCLSSAPAGKDKAKVEHYRTLYRFMASFSFSLMYLSSSTFLLSVRFCSIVMPRSPLGTTCADRTPSCRAATRIIQNYLCVVIEMSGSAPSESGGSASRAWLTYSSTSEN